MIVLMAVKGKVLPYFNYEKGCKIFQAVIRIRLVKGKLRLKADVELSKLPSKFEFAEFGNLLD